MIRLSNYCGFGDWPSCEDLATTGGGDISGLVILGLTLLVVGVLVWAAKR